MDPCSSFEEEVQEDLENEFLQIVTDCYHDKKDSVAESLETPYKAEPEKTKFLLEKADRERQELIQLNLRPKPQNSGRQERSTLKAKPVQPRRAAFDLGTPVQPSEHYRSSISSRQMEERRLFERRLRFDEGMSSLDNEHTETQEGELDSCGNENQPLNPSSICSSEGSLEEIVLDGKKINCMQPRCFTL